MDQCNWVTREQKKCTNSVLMDGLCSRHLKQKCSICWENVPSTNSSKHKRLNCGHAFHFDCILQWFKTSDECPVCRKNCSKDSIIIFRNNIEEDMRKLYYDAIKTLENEIKKLKRRQ